MRCAERKKIYISTCALSTTLCARRARVHIKGKGKGCVPGCKCKAVNGWNGEPISIPLPAHARPPCAYNIIYSDAPTSSWFPPLVWRGGDKWCSVWGIATLSETRIGSPILPIVGVGVPPWPDIPCVGREM